MIITTTETIAGKKIAKTLGIVRGATIRARHIGHDIMAGLKNIVGGEILEYTKLMAESREQAIDRMIEDAKRIGADGVVCVRFTTSVIMGGAAELLAYGTAVKFEEEV
ncbi:MAG: YbjQ family protein [Fibrobacter sp.]|nr:YbjQ family protein [Fibrobacter sp.]